MENEKEIQNKDEEITEPNSESKEDGSDQSVKEDDKVEISTKELETLKKKSTDFDKSVELKRLSKLDARKSQEEKSDNPNDEVISNLAEEIKSLREQVNNNITSEKDKNLTEAYREFIAEHKWADNDETFSKISENFKTDNLRTKEEMLAHLKSKALSMYPSEFEKTVLNKAKSQVLAEKETANAGSGGGNSAENQYAKGGETEEEKISKSFYKNFPPGFAINKKLNK